MNYRQQYNDELAKLEKLEHNYWQRWEACDQEEPRNEQYLRGVRWCMSHRLKLLTKLERLDKQEAKDAAAQTPSHAAATSRENAAPSEQQNREAALRMQQEAEELRRESQALHERTKLQRANSEGGR